MISVGALTPVLVCFHKLEIAPLSNFNHLRDGTADEAMLTEIRARDGAVHTFGNLTLVTVAGNSAASNSAFLDKKQWLNLSLLALNREIVEQETWGLDAIAGRAEAIADRAIAIWPAPPSRVVAAE